VSVIAEKAKYDLGKGAGFSCSHFG